MGKNIDLSGTDTSHIKYGNLEKPPLPPIVRKQTPAQTETRTLEQKRADEWGNK
jgi:hypothetical protein